MKQLIASLVLAVVLLVAGAVVTPAGIGTVYADDGDGG